MRKLNKVPVLIIIFVLASIKAFAGDEKLDKSFGESYKAAKKDQTIPPQYNAEQTSVTSKEVSGGYSNYTQGTSAQTAGSQAIRGNLSNVMNAGSGSNN